MKRNYYFLLLAALVFGLSFSVTSCKSDDDSNSNGGDGVITPDEVEATDNDEARTAFRWLCILTDAENFEEKWKSESSTWEPTIGVVSTKSDNTRIVVVNDLDEAREKFAKLADKEASEIGKTLILNGGSRAGTLEWKQSDEGAENIAVVTVKSKIIPHLDEIVYCTEEQVGDNAKASNMKGTAYYRFGDVIRDSKGYYWVCVRPSFAPRNKKECSSKGDSHWINIFNGSASGGNKAMPTENVKTKWNNLKKYNYQTIKLPTGLKYDREHIINLSNLIWAMLRPDTYYDLAVKREWPALGNFPYEYNGRRFVEQVTDFWNEQYNGYTIWQILFNHTYDEMKELKKIIFYYQGYSWPTGESGNVWGLATTDYKSVSGDSDKETINFVKDGFDATYYAQSSDKRVYVNRFTNDADGKKIGRWVVRYAKGEDLLSKGQKYDFYKNIAGTTDIYRFNSEMNITAGANVPAMTEADHN